MDSTQLQDILPRYGYSSTYLSPKTNIWFNFIKFDMYLFPVLEHLHAVLRDLWYITSVKRNCLRLPPSPWGRVEPMKAIIPENQATIVSILLLPFEERVRNEGRFCYSIIWKLAAGKSVVKVKLDFFFRIKLGCNHFTEISFNLVNKQQKHWRPWAWGILKSSLTVMMPPLSYPFQQPNEWW